MPAAVNNNRNKSGDEYTKLKRFILFGVIVTLVILGYHFYEYFLRDVIDNDKDAEIEHDILELTQNLFKDEVKDNPYLQHVNFQGNTHSFKRDDRAPKPLLQLNNNLLDSDTTSTTYLMKRLFDNYELDSSAVEKVTPAEQQEELDFLQAILKTKIMKRTMNFLHKKGVVEDSVEAQLQLLKDIWFTQYSRGQGRIGSSGFEHVFLSEIKNQNILGLHNWIYFSEQEAQGNLEYQGFINHMDLDKHNKFLVALRFKFHGIVKPYNTLLIGTTPELEMSLYTVCFLLNSAEPCPVQLGTTKFDVITHTWDWKGKKTIASAYYSLDDGKERT
ncbi:poly(U)-specific endoribonuclease homolog [Teleopsis dalmanni]|uniref:poly(U)-specific endoribonuclease homolog n=1 Tax=Teleopsis dalmanni TaxID=139649 RepID=UPI0018CD6603|nr:poly(U)-specific endoribonuclease homolog [Teleopsis dalmanni]